MISESVKPTSFQEIRIFGIEGLPEIHPGDDVPALLFARLSSAKFSFMPGDICVVTQKIVSKAEGSLVDLRTIMPSPFALPKRGQEPTRSLEPPPM